MAKDKEKKTRVRKIRTFKVESSPVVKGQDSPGDGATWTPVGTMGSRQDAETLVAFARKTEKTPCWYSVTEEIVTGGRQLVS